jgi:ABC-type antimicrobial peptide transport system permease subunit
MAVYIPLLALFVFVFLAVSGCYIFLKYNISPRANEFALYRAIEYKTNHIFYLVFIEYFLISSLAMMVTVVVSNFFCTYFVNLYVQTLLKDSLIHNMSVSSNVIEILAVVITFFVILLFICTKFVKQPEKIDLTILLNK